MSYFRAMCLGLIFTFSGGLLMAQSMVDTKYKRSVIPFGVFLKVGGLSYSTKGAELIKVPGEIGELQGRTGFAGYFTRNYFKRISLFENISTNQGREFIVDRKTLNKINGNGTGNAKSIPEIEGAPSVELTASYDRAGTKFEKYTGLFLQVDNWLSVEEKIKAMTIGEQQRFSADNVRIIEAVLYATGFDAGSGVTIAADVGTDVSGIEAVSFTATLSGGQTEAVSLKLKGKSAIAYSYRMLCWTGKTFDKTAPDDIGAGRSSNCGKYK